MSFSLAELPWLRRAPSDFRQLCKQAASSAEDGLLRLSSYHLQGRDAESLARLVKIYLDNGAPGLIRPLRLGVISNGTFDLIAGDMIAGAARHRIALELVLPPFDQAPQQALDPASQINSGSCDVVALFLDHRWFSLDAAYAPDGTGLEERIAQLRTIVEGLRTHSGATVLLQTCAAPAVDLFGSYDRTARVSLSARINVLNEAITAIARDNNCLLLDVEKTAAQAGTSLWFDDAKWAAYKMPFSAACTALFCDRLGGLLGAFRGLGRKCLVLDLDNTLWGGVIGDDGLSGIRLGAGSAEGEAFQRVQRHALSLYGRGIILAVSSKNDEANARLPFREHPEMLLREENIAVFQANWTDKPSNLEAIAGALNIGVDALVFLDDNPVEREAVRRALPTVAVPELPSDPALYASYLSAAGYFEAISFSEDDAIRAASYTAEAKRLTVKAAARDLSEYLASLQMELSCDSFQETDKDRVTQLINKTNQFNLTTRRYSLDQVETFMRDAKHVTLQYRLKDSFGEFGLIGLVICRVEASQAEIDTWLMSCRVLGRRVEEAMLATLAEALKPHNVTTLRGVYRPTKKNGMVADHYTKLGFTPAGNEGEDAFFTLELKTYEAPVLPFVMRASRA